MCETPPRILYSNCRGYYVDDPCCPLTYIGNETTPTTQTN